MRSGEYREGSTLRSPVTNDHETGEEDMAVWTLRQAA